MYMKITFLRSLYIFFFRTIPSAGSFNISDLLPWRRYIVQVTATSIDHRITDFIRRDFRTVEEGKLQIIKSEVYTVNPFYTDTQYNDKNRYNDNLTGTKLSLKASLRR